MKIIFVPLFALALASCNTEDDAQLISSGLAIIGTPPVEQITTAKNKPGNARFEFQTTPDILLDWIYRWEPSRERFKVVDFKSFSGQTIRLVNASGSILLYSGETERSIHGTHHKYHFDLYIIKVRKGLWKCRIDIFMLE